MVTAVLILVLPSVAAAVTTLPVPSNIGTGGIWLTASSCPSAGSCSAVAGYSTSGGDGQVALFDQVDGAWKLTVLDLSHLPSLDPSGDLAPESISCASAGNCTVVGYYQDMSRTYQGFAATETGGVWSPASEVQMPTNVNTTNYGTGHTGDEDLVLVSVSCVSAGNCTVFGAYDANPADNDVPFVLTQSNGAWAQAVQAPLPTDASQVYGGLAPAQVSCPLAGSCTAYGAYATTGGSYAPFVLTETGGSWTTAPLSLSGLSDPAAAQPNFLTASGAGTIESSLACPSAGNCAAVGSYTDTSGGQQGVIFNEINGVWNAATANVSYLSLPAASSSQSVALASVSCSSAGNCAADGVFLSRYGNLQGLRIIESGGAWQNAGGDALPSDAKSGGDAYPLSIACSAAGNCVMPTFYTSNANTTEQALQSWGGYPFGLATVPLSATLAGGTTASQDGSAVACAADGYCSMLDTFPNSDSIVAMNAPGAFSATVQAGIDKATLIWSAPTDDGGFPITGYTASANEIPQSPHGSATQAPGPSATSVWFGLASGHSYELTISATNLLGIGIPESGIATVLPSRTELADMVSEVAWPTGPKANLKAIRKARGFRFSYQALQGGTLAITWYYDYAVGHGNRRKKHHAKVAAGTVKMAGVGRYSIDLKLTAAGRRLVARNKTLRLTEKLTLTSTNQPPIRMSKAFTLR